MKLTFLERLVLIVLSALLLIGTIILHLRHSRSYHEITVIENGIKEQFTLKQVEERLKESRRIDINTATSKEITIIPGVGEVLAARIVEYRDAHGIFSRADELLKVKGIGEKKFKRIKEYIRID